MPSRRASPRPCRHRLAEGFLVSLTGAALERRGSGPTLTVLGLSIKDASGREIISAPKAEVDFDPLRLFRNDAGLRRLALIAPQFKASISRQGEISLMTAFSQPMPAPLAAPADAPADAAASPAADALPPDHVRHGLIATYDDLFGPHSPFRVVNFVGIEDGRLVVDDQRSSDQIVFTNVTASFERDAARARASRLERPFRRLVARRRDRAQRRQ